MLFQRKNYIGFDFTWYGVDNSGSIAQFVTGYAPIPEKVFFDKKEYELVDNHFNNLPDFTETHLSSKYENKISFL